MVGLADLQGLLQPRPMISWFHDLPPCLYLRFHARSRRAAGRRMPGHPHHEIRGRIKISLRILINDLVVRQSLTGSVSARDCSKTQPLPCPHEHRRSEKRVVAPARVRCATPATTESLSTSRRWQQRGRGQGGHGVCAQERWAGGDPPGVAGQRCELCHLEIPRGETRSVRVCL